jgi:hypothetical protein
MLYPNLKFAWDQIDLGVLEGIGKLSPFFISSLVMSIAVYFQGTWLSGIGLSQFAILPMQIITGALIYFGILMLLYRNLVLGLLNELRSKKPQMEAF